MSYLGIKKRQGIPIVREGEANTLNTKIKRKKRKQKQPIILIHRYL